MHKLLLKKLSKTEPFQLLKYYQQPVHLFLSYEWGKKKKTFIVNLYFVLFYLKLTKNIFII